MIEEHERKQRRREEDKTSFSSHWEWEWVTGSQKVQPLSFWNTLSLFYHDTK
jgi:hypothetical protein